MSQEAAPANNDQPDWLRLPNDPVGFFGLSPGFDRKDLKRAYNALLRRYKPDKCPQEFQKLRAAFEQLDSQLRYGETQSVPTSRIDEQDWTEAFNSVPMRPQPTTEVSESDKSRGRKSLEQLIEAESWHEAYEQLKQNPREPYDYYALAIMSDALADPGEQLFLHWLLKGIKALPGSAGLTQLLIAYFENGDLPNDQLAPTLVRVSQVIGKDRFYFLTEKLFDRLTLSAPWAEVEATLKQCAANINDHSIRSRVVFTCHLLRRALWLAPLDTCKEMLATINQHYEFLEGRLEYEQELNSLLLNYVEARERFVVKGPIAQMIDQALRKYCLDTDGRGDYEIVKTQAHIAHHPQQLFREFRLTPSEDMQLLVPWIWLSDEVEDRLETQEHPPKPAQLVNATFHMMQQIDQNFPLTPVQLFNVLSHVVPIIMSILLVLLVAVPTYLLSEHYCPTLTGYIAPISVLIGGILAVVYWFRLKRYTTSVWLINYLRRQIEKQYLSWWRSLIARFMAATHFPYRDIDRAIDGLLETRRSELNMSHWLPHFYSRDPALYVYATAVRFLR